MQLLFEEFGKWLNASADATMVQRDETFATIFDESTQIINQPGSALQGLGKLIWAASIWKCSLSTRQKVSAFVPLQ